MNHAFVIFAYPGNAALVPQTMRSIARLHPHAHVAVAIETGDDAAYPANAHIIRTAFDRRGNLNGPAACFGILENMVRFGRFVGAEFVWKVDPDTILTSDAVFRDLADKDIAGFQCPSNRADIERPEETMLGCCYGIRTKSIPFLLLECAEWGIAPDAPEDVTITRAAYGANYRRHALPVNQTTPAPALFFWRWDAPLPVERYSNCAGVNLGNPGGTVEQQVALAARLVDQMPGVDSPASVRAVQSRPKPARAPQEVIELRVLMPCEHRTADGRCQLSKTCRGNCTCQTVATWRDCPAKHWTV